MQKTVSDMRIAFDLDNTLLRFQEEFPLEKSYSEGLRNFLGLEPLRQGTSALIRALKKESHEIWVYTASARSKRHIYGVFMMYGIFLDGVVNYDVHLRERPHIGHSCVKYPPYFDIDVLIDDAEGIQLEGERLGYPVILVNPGDKDWHRAIRHKIHHLDKEIPQNKLNNPGIR